MRPAGPPRFSLPALSAEAEQRLQDAQDIAMGIRRAFGDLADFMFCEDYRDEGKRMAEEFRFDCYVREYFQVAGPVTDPEVETLLRQILKQPRFSFELAAVRRAQKHWAQQREPCPAAWWADRLREVVNLATSMHVVREQVPPRYMPRKRRRTSEGRGAIDPRQN